PIGAPYAPRRAACSKPRCRSGCSATPGLTEWRHGQDMLALEGIKILDLSRLAPGPFCSMMLGDLGADVLLVEAPPDQLPGRGLAAGAPARVPAGAAAARPASGPAYNALGRNKR